MANSEFFVRKVLINMQETRLCDELNLSFAQIVALVIDIFFESCQTTQLDETQIFVTFFFKILITFYSFTFYVLN